MGTALSSAYRAPRVPYRVGSLQQSDRTVPAKPPWLRLGMAGLGVRLLLGFRLDFGLDFGWILASA